MFKLKSLEIRFVHPSWFSIKMLCLRVTFVFLLSTYVVSEAFRSDFQGHDPGKCLDEVERDPTI